MHVAYNLLSVNETVYWHTTLEKLLESSIVSIFLQGFRFGHSISHWLIQNCSNFWE